MFNYQISNVYAILCCIANSKKSIIILWGAKYTVTWLNYTIWTTSLPGSISTAVDNMNKLWPRTVSTQKSSYPLRITTNSWKILPEWEPPRIPSAIATRPCISGVVRCSRENGWARSSRCMGWKTGRWIWFIWGGNTEAGRKVSLKGGNKLMITSLLGRLTPLHRLK